MSNPVQDPVSPEPRVIHPPGGLRIEEGTPLPQRGSSIGRVIETHYNPNYLARAGLILLTILTSPISIPVLLCSSKAQRKFHTIWQGKKVQHLNPQAAQANNATKYKK